MTTKPHSLPSSQSDFFEEHGYLRLNGFHPRRLVDRIRRELLGELKRQRIWAGGKTLSRQLQALPAFQQITRLSTSVSVQGLHEALMTPELSAAVAHLAGRAQVAAESTQLLMSLPHQGDWTLNGLNWHVDVASGPQDPLPGIQAFVLIDDVVPRGGATLALAGSHRIQAMAGAERSALRELLSTTADLEAELQAKRLSIVEMSGKAGDVVLMDMRVLHTPSINASKNVRMMATARFFVR
jgi:ectoine hydroxylase-related dioxygenase (phytanoyl-CoA dioxygenase family)